MKKLLIILIVFTLFSCNRINTTRTITDDTQNQEETTETDLILSESDFDDFDFGDFGKFEFDTSRLRISNGRITTDYSVSDIINVHTSVHPGDLPNDFITENYCEITWNGFRLIFKNNINTNNTIKLTLIGDTNQYETNLQLFSITDYLNGDIFGYYAEVEFENKPWLNNNDNIYLWQIIVKSGDEELINDELIMEPFTSLFFNRLDPSPFIVNNLRTAGINTEYTYRFRTMDADILVIYYYVEIFEPHYGSIYKPVLYILPENNDGYFSDIKISWNSEELRGTYSIGRYKLNDLPKEEREFPVFNWINVR